MAHLAPPFSKLCPDTSERKKQTNKFVQDKEDMELKVKFALFCKFYGWM